MTVELAENYAKALDLQLDNNFSQKKFISSIIEEPSPNLAKLEFCYQAVKKTLSALLHQQYSAFDAQTTSNCCHGLSLLIQDLIRSVNRKELSSLFLSICSNIEIGQVDPHFSLPEEIIDLTKAYLLAYIRTICPIKGVRSSINRLKEISPIGTAFCTDLVAVLQKEFSNRVAFRYQEYLEGAKGKVHTCGIPVDEWGKYVKAPYLRKSSRGIYFTSSLFSLQVSLAHLILNQSKIAMVNDIYNAADELVKRDIRILKGNGSDGFIPINLADLVANAEEPVVVFGGCAYSEEPELVVKNMNQWIGRFSHLVLANEVFYPQFPKACDTPYLQDAPIVPTELMINQLIDRYRKVRGVSAKDPSFYLLNHIYPSSLHQILLNDLPSYKIPKILLKSEPVFP